ncbi:23S rRNA (uracil1939-C5)-methyltransferase [Acetanaerobacterium elongatum]|uniref:23S rRNA (Uracil1939-C5)-methyltransferase n=2 Tax=Acetanaerobacterium elongatum TaxID=258515 RepID=A0A1H0A9Y8_9FIRM|nr:23S rRNA (uracil1939-C5)-methyltransferase [Acetanaerobacterium elongatum]
MSKGKPLKWVIFMVILVIDLSFFRFLRSVLIDERMEQTMTLKKNDIIPLEITDITNEGNGVGRADGLAVFVPMTVVGDILRVHITKVLKSYAYGIVKEIVAPGAGRITADCSVFSRCGGCSYRHMSYEAELNIKKKQVFDALKRIGGLHFEEQMIIPSPQTEGYRNKAQYPVRADENGHCIAGFFAQRSHRLISCTDCTLQPKLFEEVTNEVLAFANRYKIPPYKEENGSGLLRHIYLRYAGATGELMVCLVINGKNLPHADMLIQTLTEKHPQVKSIVLNHNRADTNVILGEKCTTLYGSGTITDILRGVKVRLSPLSFYQVNRLGAERLYEAVEEFAQPNESDLLLDLYCGAGTIGLSMARKVNKLIGVEIVPEAVDNARENAVLNGFSNCEFLCADASGAALELERRGTKPDIIILDPPRKGSDYECLSAVVRMNPSRIIMVSCNPATLARDLKQLEELGYKAEKARAVDMFPRTAHVECVVLMSRVENQP